MAKPMFSGTGAPLSEGGLNRAAAQVNAGLPALWAVMTVETKGCGFLPDRRPQILFERHVFHERTGGKYSSRAPEISNPAAGGYGPAGAHQFDRLESAMELDRKAALESTSWGLGQVMGFNAAVVGFSGVENMVEAMCESEDAQFQAMIAYIVAESLAQYLQSADWTEFARRYNGANFQKNKYDEKLARAHARFVAGPLPSLPVRAVQLYLSYLGYAPGAVDGWFGVNTQSALLRFQRTSGLEATGQVDESVLAALEKAAATDTND